MNLNQFTPLIFQIQLVATLSQLSSEIKRRERIQTWHKWCLLRSIRTTTKMYYSKSIVHRNQAEISNVLLYTTKTQPKSKLSFQPQPKSKLSFTPQPKSTLCFRPLSKPPDMLHNTKIRTKFSPVQILQPKSLQNYRAPPIKPNKLEPLLMPQYPIHSISKLYLVQ